MPFLYGCPGTSIAWCCKSIEVWHIRNPRQGVRLLAIDCVTINGAGVNPEQTGPIQP